MVNKNEVVPLCFLGNPPFQMMKEMATMLSGKEYMMQHNVCPPGDCCISAFISAKTR